MTQKAIPNIHCSCGRTLVAKRKKLLLQGALIVCPCGQEHRLVKARKPIVIGGAGIKIIPEDK